MKRRLLTILVFLLAGAVVNVAVAWGCASCCKARPPQRYATPTPDQVAWWAASAPDDIACDPLIVATMLGFGSRYDSLRGIRPDPDLPILEVSDYALRAHAGWPLTSIEGERWDIGVPRGARLWAFTPANVNAVYVASLPIHWSNSTGTRERLLPLRPLPVGFTINTIFYAAVLWLLVSGPFALRRFLRVRRGLCPKCAYPMGVSTTCTECGQELPRRATVPT